MARFEQSKQVPGWVSLHPKTSLVIGVVILVAVVLFVIRIL